MYTSVKESKNCSLLKKYLLHRIYGFPFKVPASVLDRESIFMWVYVLKYWFKLDDGGCGNNDVLFLVKAMTMGLVMLVAMVVMMILMVILMTMSMLIRTVV